MNILMILCFSFNFIKNEKIIYTNFINGLKGYYVEYKIGNKNFIIKKYINLQNSYTLIPNSLFNSNYSSSLKIIKYKIY